MGKTSTWTLKKSGGEKRMHTGSWIMSLDGDLRTYERGKGVRIMSLSQFISVTLRLRCLYIINMKTNDHWTTKEMGIFLKISFLYAFPAMIQVTNQIALPKILTFLTSHWLYFVSLKKSNISVICTFWRCISGICPNQRVIQMVYTYF